MGPAWAIIVFRMANIMVSHDKIIMTGRDSEKKKTVH